MFQQYPPRRPSLLVYSDPVTRIRGNSLAVQWLGLHALMAKSLGSIPGQETKISRAVYRSQKKTVRNCPFPLDNTGINLLNFLNNLVGLKNLID